MKGLVIAEHDQQQLHEATRHALCAAAQMSQSVDVLVVGQDCQSVAQQAAQLEQVNRVHVIEDPRFLNQGAQVLSSVVRDFVQPYQAVICASTSFGKDLLPRVCAQLGVSMIADVIEIEDPKTFIRPIYAGNALARVVSCDPICCLTIRASAFSVAKEQSKKALIENHQLTTNIEATTVFVGRECPNQTRPDLTQAQIVVSGGRGVGSAEQFALIEQLADVLGAGLGASRAAVDAGFVSNDLQIGQTGKIVAPKLYIAIGISGAIQHLAGMKDSGVIVAINSDPSAPIFDVADYGLVGDLHQIVPELIACLS